MRQTFFPGGEVPKHLLKIINEYFQCGMQIIQPVCYGFQPLNRLQLIHPNVPSHYRPFRVFEYCFPVLQSGEQLDFRYLLFFVLRLRRENI
jgi:hypothetical protein